MHPVEKDKYLLGTKPIEEWANCCAHWWEIGLPGAYTCGERRLGKTRAARWVRLHRERVFGRPCACFFVPQRTYGISTPRKFLSHLLQATGHSLHSSGDESAMRTRLAIHLKESVASLEDQRVILMVDEAQDLHRMDYKVLINLSNELEEDDVRIFVLLIGQPELEARCQVFKSTRQRHILGRFMGDSFHFRGIESAMELRHVFHQYDAKMFYPEDSDISYTQAFAGEGFHRGFRLADQADLTWSVMQQMRDEYGIKSKMSIPMRSVTSFANYVLLRFAGNLSGALELKESQLREALANTTFLLLEA